MKRTYVLYDQRATYNEDDAEVLSVADSLKEARFDRRTLYPGAVIFEYEDHNGTLKNGKVVA